MIKPDTFDPNANRYPNTDFVTAATEGMPPLGQQLVRCVYLAQFFGQSDPLLTDYFTDTVVQEPTLWLEEERRSYPDAYRHAERFFENNGAAQLAEASTPGGEVAADVTAVSRGIKQDFLVRSWQRFASTRLTNEKVRTAPDALVTMRQAFNLPTGSEPLDNAEKRRAALHVGALWRSIEVDRRHVIEGRRSGMYERESHESIVRESMLAHPRYVTGSTVLNLELSYQQAVGAVLAKPEIRQLARAWRKAHKGTDETFLPPEFDGASDLLMRTPSRRALGWLITPILRSILRRHMPEELR